MNPALTPVEIDTGGALGEGSEGRDTKGYDDEGSCVPVAPARVAESGADGNVSPASARVTPPTDWITTGSTNADSLALKGGERGVELSSEDTATVSLTLKTSSEPTAELGVLTPGTIRALAASDEPLMTGPTGAAPEIAALTMDARGRGS